VSLTIFYWLLGVAGCLLWLALVNSQRLPNLLHLQLSSLDSLTQLGHVPRLPPPLCMYISERWFHSFVVCDSEWLLTTESGWVCVAPENVGVQFYVWSEPLLRLEQSHLVKTNSLSKRKKEKRKSHPPVLTCRTTCSCLLCKQPQA
jgi:hypothetical protein